MNNLSNVEGQISKRPSQEHPLIVRTTSGIELTVAENSDCFDIELHHPALDSVPICVAYRLTPAQLEQMAIRMLFIASHAQDLDENLLEKYGLVDSQVFDPITL